MLVQLLPAAWLEISPPQPGRGGKPCHLPRQGQSWFSLMSLLQQPRTVNLADSNCAGPLALQGQPGTQLKEIYPRGVQVTVGALRVLWTGPLLTPKRQADEEGRKRVLNPEVGLFPGGEKIFFLFNSSLLL